MSYTFTQFKDALQKSSPTLVRDLDLSLIEKGAYGVASAFDQIRSRPYEIASYAYVYGWGWGRKVDGGMSFPSKDDLLLDIDSSLVGLDGIPEIFQPHRAKIKGVYMSGGAFSDNQMLQILPVRALECLKIHDSNFTDAAASRLDAFAELRYLSLGSDQITSVSLSAISKLKNLRVLSLWGARITADDLKFIGLLDELMALDLPHVQVHSGLHHLKGLTNLRSLDIGDTDFTAEDLAELESLPRLQKLNLAGRHLRRDDYAALERLPHLAFVILTDGEGHFEFESSHPEIEISTSMID